MMNLFLFISVLNIATLVTDTVVTHHARVETGDSAHIVAPAYKSVLAGPVVDYRIIPRCSVGYADLYVTVFPSVTETLAYHIPPPFQTRWDIGNIPDQDQIALHFGYTLYLVSGDTVVSPLLINRWCISRPHSRPKVRAPVCRQLALRRPVVIDARDNEWRPMRFYPLGARASFACAWSPAEFFVFVKVRDSTVTAFDRVEVCFDMYRSRSVMLDSLHRVFSFGPAARGFMTAVALEDSAPKILDSLTGRAREEVRWRTLVDSGGYYIEACIPLAILSDMTVAPRSAGFNISVIDKNSADALPQVVSYCGAKASQRYSPATWASVQFRGPLALHNVMFGTLAAIAATFVIVAFSIKIVRTIRESIHPDQTTVSHSPAMQKVVACITIHCTKPSFSPDDAAAYVGMTPEKIRELLRRETSMPFSMHLDRARIQVAKKLLRDTDELPEEIVRKCGYTSETAFTAAFKHFTGTGPEAYRTCQRRENADEDDVDT